MSAGDNAENRTSVKAHIDELLTSAQVGQLVAVGSDRHPPEWWQGYMAALGDLRRWVGR